MSPEERQQFNEMQDKVKELETLVRAMQYESEMPPEMVRSIQNISVGLAESGESVTDYDQAVSESGSGNYNVPAQFDGLSVLNGKLYGYYNL